MHFDTLTADSADLEPPCWKSDTGACVTREACACAPLVVMFDFVFRCSRVFLVGRVNHSCSLGSCSMASESSDETVLRAMLAQNCWFETSYHPVATALGHRYVLHVFEARALRSCLALSIPGVGLTVDGQVWAHLGVRHRFRCATSCCHFV